MRNTVLTQEANEISIERKVREAQLAMDLEKQYPQYIQPNSPSFRIGGAGYNTFAQVEHTVRMDQKPVGDRLPVVDGQVVTQTASVDAGTDKG